MTPDELLEIQVRVTECNGQIEESPYSHTTAAGWYAHDVPLLTAALERAERDRDAHIKALQECERLRADANLREIEAVVRAERAETQADEQGEQAEAAEARAQKAEAERDEIDGTANEFYERMVKAEAVVEAARYALEQHERTTGFISEREALRKIKDALTAYDEPPTEKATIDDLFIPVKPGDEPPTVLERKIAEQKAQPRGAPPSVLPDPVDEPPTVQIPGAGQVGC